MKPKIKLRTKNLIENAHAPELEESLSNSPGYRLDTLSDDEAENLEQRYEAARGEETRILEELKRAHATTESLRAEQKADQLRLRSAQLEEFTKQKVRHVAELQDAEKVAAALRTAYVEAQKRQGALRRELDRDQKRRSKAARRAEKLSAHTEKQDEKDLKFEIEYSQSETLGRIKIARAAAKAHIKRLRMLVTRRGSIPLDPLYEFYVGYREKHETPQQTVFRLLRHFQNKVITLDQDYVQAVSGPGIIINEHALFPRKDEVNYYEQAEAEEKAAALREQEEEFEENAEKDALAPKKILKRIQLRTKRSEPDEDAEQPEPTADADEAESETAEQALERRLASVKPKAVLSADSIHLVKP